MPILGEMQFESESKILSPVGMGAVWMTGGILDASFGLGWTVYVVGALQARLRGKEARGRPPMPGSERGSQTEGCFRVPLFCLTHCRRGDGMGCSDPFTAGSGGRRDG